MQSVAAIVFGMQIVVATNAKKLGVAFPREVCLLGAAAAE